MTAGVGMIGREVTATVGGTALQGVITKSVSMNNEPLDSTDDASSGWQERLAKAGLKSVEFSISGLLKNLELVQAFAGTSQLFAILITYTDGSTLAFNAFMDSISETGESNALKTFDASFSSSGPITFTAGV